MTCSWSPLMSDSLVPSQSLFCPKCPVTFFAISPLWPLHFSVCCKILVPSGLWLLVQTQLFHVPLKSIIILVFFAAHVTNAIETSLMKTFHVAVKPVFIFEFLVAFFAIDCLDGVHNSDVMLQRNLVLEFSAANLTHLNIICVDNTIVCFYIRSIFEQFTTWWTPDLIIFSLVFFRFWFHFMVVEISSGIWICLWVFETEDNSKATPILRWESHTYELIIILGVTYAFEV